MGGTSNVKFGWADAPKPVRMLISHRKLLAVVTLVTDASIAGSGRILAAYQPIPRTLQPAGIVQKIPIVQAA